MNKNHILGEMNESSSEISQNELKKHFSDKYSLNFFLRFESNFYYLKIFYTSSYFLFIFFIFGKYAMTE